MNNNKPFVKYVKNTLIYWAICLLAAFIRLVPRSVSLVSMKLLVRIGSLPAKGEWRKINNNLVLAFGQSLTEKDRHSIGRRVFSNSAGNIVDAVLAGRLLARDVDTHMPIRGFEIAQHALAKGRGIVFLTAHTGCFELLPPRFSLLGFPMLVLGAPSYDDRIGTLIAQNRSRFNVTYLERQESPRAIIEWLRAGKALGVLCDLDTRVESRFVPFFNVPAKTVVGPFKLGLRLQAPLVPIFTERMPDDTQRITLYPELVPAGGSDDDKVRSVMEQFNAILEGIIRNDPAQWIWMHDRWKSKP